MLITIYSRFVCVFQKCLRIRIKNSSTKPLNNTYSICVSCNVLVRCLKWAMLTIVKVSSWHNISGLSSAVSIFVSVQLVGNNQHQSRPVLCHRVCMGSIDHFVFQQCSVDVICRVIRVSMQNLSAIFKRPFPLIGIFTGE